MKIKLTSVFVNDQDKALRFYTEVLGFAKKADFSQGPYRWLTVASPEEPDGTELQLALNDNPAGKAYQQAIFQQGQPAAMFYTDDIKGDYERIKAHGAEFTMPPTDVTASTIAMLNDTCGNLIQAHAVGTLLRVEYTKSGICVRNHCGAEPPRDTEPPGLVTTVGWRDFAAASYVAADRIKAPARAARGRLRGIHGGRPASSLPTEA